MALQTVKSGMPVIISFCSHKTIYAEYRYNGCKHEVKKDIIKWAIDGAGVRAIAREYRKKASVSENLVRPIS
jgi:hypothetical protein